MSILEIQRRFASNTLIAKDDPIFDHVFQEVEKSLKLIAKLNASGDFQECRPIFKALFGEALDEGTVIFTPFTTNFGKFTKIGKNVFINHGCSFLDLGGITIEDDVQIAPQVKLVTENHPLNPKTRKGLILSPILIKKNAWIGAGAMILPGVTIGENSVVAAGAVVSKDVPDHTVVGGVPAKIIKSIEN
ncbi:sugar O-acetyltransferase [Algoriphagus sp.]|uniref:sugar O-acetyltransferase n=1 Tax=Algoriphagus sp. TaxID=1872435 RepID=UPI00260DC4F9|nr:sugar O-acetyltransferase [Algoriphagus sp.]